MQNILKTIWLFISSFGIMFAVLSWLQEAGVLSNADGWWKGGFALALWNHPLSIGSKTNGRLIVET
jgi:hypothetical protein